MNQKNFEYLRDQVKYTGFGEGLANDLKRKIDGGDPKFELQHRTQYGNDLVIATLNFSRSKQSEMYFFNSYHVVLQKGDSFPKMGQTFYINKGNAITLKEAYNLMQGRAVNKNLISKEGKVYNAWLQMDFNQTDNRGNYKWHQYHQNYEYDLEATLAKYPIRELDNGEYRSNLIESLKKGNLQSVTFHIGEEDQKRYIEANPKFKTINIYDGNFKRINNRQSVKEEQSVDESHPIKRPEQKEKQVPTEDVGLKILKKSKKRKRIRNVS